MLNLWMHAPEKCCTSLKNQESENIEGVQRELNERYNRGRLGDEWVWGARMGCVWGKEAWMSIW